jgi:hypothetical protein
LWNKDFRARLRPAARDDAVATSLAALAGTEDGRAALCVPSSLKEGFQAVSHCATALVIAAELSGVGPS